MLPDLIYRIDSNGKILDCNQTVLTTLKYSKEELIGNSVFALYSDDSKEDAKKYFKEFLPKGKLQNKELKLVAKDGSLIDVELSANALYDSSGNIEGSISVHHNITERKQMENLQRGLIHADRIMVIGQLAAGIAHEINNPAAFVMANISSMQKNLSELKNLLKTLYLFYDPNSPEKFLEALKEVERLNAIENFQKITNEFEDVLKESQEGMERIRSIVRDLRVFSRIEQDELESVEINDIVNTAINMTFSEIRHKAKLEKDLAEIPSIVADRAKIAQVVVNMLLNAAQAIPKGKVAQNKIKIITRKDDKDITIEIIDTGCGITKENLSKIFYPFFTTKPRDLGTGLGLTLCTDIVNKHHGRIDVKSKVGKGSSFIIRLPINTDLSIKSEEPSKLKRISVKRRAKILIVDDEVLLLNAYKRGLEPDHEVLTVNSAEKALQILGSDPSFDLVLCDIVMPEMDGMEFFNKLKVKLPTYTKKVVFCSGSGGSTSKEFCRSIGNILLEKPISMQKLKEAIDGIISTNNH